jgi:hypothetical protein
MVQSPNAIEYKNCYLFVLCASVVKKTYAENEKVNLFYFSGFDLIAGVYFPDVYPPRRQQWFRWRKDNLLW